MVSKEQEWHKAYTRKAGSIARDSMKLRCSSCGIPIVGTGFSMFKCPDCGEGQLTRCRHCRDQSVEYSCPECGFVGP